MELIFRGKHLDLDDQFRSYASERLGKLARYLPAVGHAIVDVRREAKGREGRFVVQVTLNVNGTFLRAEERNFEMLAAVDATVETLSPLVSPVQQKKNYPRRGRAPPGRRRGGGGPAPPPPRRQLGDDPAADEMIITITLNPAIDQTLVLPKFVAGDTLRVKSSRFDPGGKGINVSRVVKELGGDRGAGGG